MTPNEFIQREKDIREAVAAFPDEEMGEAYRKWCMITKKDFTLLNTNDPTLKAVKAVLHQAMRRPCNQPSCDGEQILEGVCEGCVEGKAGYRSKWTCNKCMHRELSKKIYLEWFETTEGK
jgi:hypothetical protein